MTDTPSLLDAAAALLRTARAGTPVAAAEGFRSLAFQTHADQIAAAWRDLAAAVGRATEAEAVEVPTAKLRHWLRTIEQATVARVATFGRRPDDPLLPQLYATQDEMNEVMNRE
jgi:hypothetical protein